MSTQFSQTRIGQSTQFGKNGNRVATNPLAPSGQRIEMRQNDDVTPSRTSGAPAVEPDDYITFAQFQAQSKWINPARVLADTNQALSGIPASIDGINTLVDGDRIALINQTAPAENGMWIIRAGAWERPSDFNTGASAANRTFFVEEGNTYADTAWTVTTDPPNDIIDTDPLTLVQIAGPGAITQLQNIGAGTGLIPAGIQGPGLVNMSTVAEGNGITTSGGAGVGALTIDATILGSAVAGTANVIQSNPVGGPSRLRDVQDTATVTWTVNGDGNLEATAVATGLAYDTIYYVSLTGSAANSGLEVNEPTDLATALANANAAGNACIALMDQGTYTSGGPITIIGDNVSIVSFFNENFAGPAPVQISDDVTVQAPGFVAKGVGFTGSMTLQASPANFSSCAFFGAVNITELGGAVYVFEDSIIVADFNVSGTVGPDTTIIIVNTQTTGGGSFSFTHGGAGTLQAIFVNCPQLASPVSLGQSATGNTVLAFQSCASAPDVSVTATGTGSYFINYANCGSVGALTINDTSTGDNSVRFNGCADINSVTATSVGGTLDLRMYASLVLGGVDLSNGNGVLLFQSTVIGNSGSGTLDIAAGYSFEISDTSFSEAGSNLLGSEVTSNTQQTSDFSSIRINAQPTGIDPSGTDFDLLFRLGGRGFVETISSSNFQRALTAGQGIDPAALAGTPNTVQTQDPVNGNTGSGVAGVNRVLAATFTAQGDGIVTVGSLPDNARVLRTAVVIDAPAIAGNADLGYNGGTGTELQDGAVVNDVTIADTYLVEDLIRNTAGAQDVELAFSGMTGTVTGEVFVEFFVLQAP